MKAENHPARSLDRRTFLAASVGTVLASPRLVAASQDFEDGRAIPDANSERLLSVLKFPRLLGRPSSWQAVEGGLFPIPLERMVILGPPDRQSAIGLGGPDDQQASSFWPTERNVRGNEDRDRCERIAKILATYYGLPERKDDWAELIGMNDPLEPPVSCEGVFLSDLDKHGSSPLVHWWVFVYGEANRRKDSKQPHFTLVQASSGLDSREAGLAGFYLAHMTFRIHGYPKKWGRITSMDHLEATRFVNDQMVKALRGLPA